MEQCQIITKLFWQSSPVKDCHCQGKKAPKSIPDDDPDYDNADATSKQEEKIMENSENKKILEC
jgi:hypothetical protein